MTSYKANAWPAVLSLQTRKYIFEPLFIFKYPYFLVYKMTLQPMKNFPKVLKLSYFLKVKWGGRITHPQSWNKFQHAVNRHIKWLPTFRKLPMGWRVILYARKYIYQSCQFEKEMYSHLVKIQVLIVILKFEFEHLHTFMLCKL